MKCPFVYKNGKKCSGRIDKIKLIDTIVEFEVDEDDNLKLIDLDTIADIRLHCSKRESHAKWGEGNKELKVWFSALPDKIQKQTRAANLAVTGAKNVF